MDRFHVYSSNEADVRPSVALGDFGLHLFSAEAIARRTMVTWVAAAAALLLSGCIWLGPTYEEAANSRLIGANYQAADALVGSTTIEPGKALLVANLVDIDNPNASSQLGRLVAAHVSSRLSQRGLPVLAQMPGEPVLQRTTHADLLLSRDARELAAAKGIQAVVVGTYAPAENYVYVTLKLVRSVDNMVLAAHNYVLPLDDNVASLLFQMPFR